MIRRALAYCLSAAVAGTLAGCAQAPYRAKVASLSSSCVGKWTQLKADTPSFPNAKQEDAPAEEFADHAACLGPPALPMRASVRLYDLGGLRRPAQLQVSLSVTTGGTLAGAVDLLDANFKLLQHHGFGEFARRGGAYTLPVFLRDQVPRYLALSPDLKFVGRQVQTIGSVGGVAPVSSAYGSVMIVHGEEVKQTIPLMAGGMMSVRVVSSPASTPAPAPSAP